MLKKKDFNLIKSRRTYGKKSVASQDTINMLKKALFEESEVQNNEKSAETFDTLSADTSNDETIIENTDNNVEEIISSVSETISDTTAPQVIYNEADLEIKNETSFLSTASIEEIIDIITEDDSYNTDFSNNTFNTSTSVEKGNANIDNSVRTIVPKEENIVKEGFAEIEDNKEDVNNDDIQNFEEDINIEDIVENSDIEDIDISQEEENILEEVMQEENVSENNNDSEDILIEDKNSDELFLNKLMNVIDEIPSENLKEFTNSVETIQESDETQEENLNQELINEETDDEDISDTKSFISDQSGDLSEIQKYLINLYTQNINEERHPKTELEDYTSIEEDEEEIIEDNVEDNQSSLEEDYLPEDNNVLLISEKKGKVFLPYTISDLDSYLKMFPNKYESYEDVIKCEFILPLKYFQGAFTFTARFREAYALYKYREGKTVIESTILATKLAKKSELHPAIIAACKSEKILNNYIKKLDSNKLSEFKDFEIEFKINPTVA